MAELSTMPKAPTRLYGHELIPGLQGDLAIGTMLAELGGLPRGAMLVRRANFVADTASTSAGDPGAGNVRWNHATQASATHLFIDDSDADANDLSSLWPTLSAGGFVYLWNPDDLAIWQVWQVTAVSDAAGYLDLTVSYQGGAGSFADDADVVLTLQQPSPAAGVDRNVVTTVASSGGTLTLDASLGDYFKTTLTENTTLVIANALPGCTLNLDIVQGSTPWTVTWPASTKWQGGTGKSVSTASGALDKLVITTTNTGTTWLAELGKAYA